MDYEIEMEKLNKESTWKPEIGVHDIFVMDEPTETEYIDSDGKKTPQILIKIRVKDKELNWYVSKGKTTKSIYGQLIYLGKTIGQLKGQNFQLIVNTVKNSKGEERNSYTIPEAIKAMEINKVKTENIKTE